MLLKPREINGPRTELLSRGPLLRRALLLTALIGLVVFLQHRTSHVAEDVSPQAANPAEVADKEPSRDQLKASIQKDIHHVEHGKKIASDIGDNEYSKGKDFVRTMMAQAWGAYWQHARDFDELNPISRTGSNFYGRDSLSLTAIDALDTLLIMGLQEEFQQAKQMALDVSFDHEMRISLFESNIRIIGGFLSTFALTGDGIYVSKAFDLANRYLAAFSINDSSDDLEKGGKFLFPLREVDLMGNFKSDEDKARLRRTMQPGVVILAEVGTLTMELAYLAHITKDRTLINEAERIIERLGQIKSRYPGLLPKLVRTDTLEQTDGGYYSVGGMADSYYEYLLKYYLQTGNLEHKRLLEESLEGIKKYLLKEIDGNVYVIGLDGDKEDLRMEHLSCFIGGFYALAGHHLRRNDYIELAGKITESCYRMYSSQKGMGLSPEIVDVPSMEPSRGERHYILRPEVVESIYMLYKVTGDVKYRRWGLEIAQSIDKHCHWTETKRSADSPTAHNAAPIKVNGFVSYYDVVTQQAKDRQESFFLAETLKYLYLLFCERDFLPLDKWLFNTEAHPLPILTGGNAGPSEEDVNA